MTREAYLGADLLATIGLRLPFPLEPKRRGDKVAIRTLEGEIIDLLWEVGG